MGPAVFFITILAAMTPPPPGDTLTPRVDSVPRLEQPTLKAIEPIEEQADLESLDVDALLEGEMVQTVYASPTVPDVRCLEIDPDRPLECISKTERCLLIDGKLSFCKSLPKVE